MRDSWHRKEAAPLCEMNVLFVCSRNRRRSPTAEAIYANVPGMDVRSAGVSTDAENPVSLEDIQWADCIFAMEQIHLQKLRNMFQGAMGAKRCFVLGIADDYTAMQPELVELLRMRIDPILRRAGF